MSKLRFRISMSLDGFVAGPHQSVDNPLGVGGMRLHEWVFPLRAWRAMHGESGGEVDESNHVVEESLANVDAVTLKEVHALAKKYFKTGNIAFAALGNLNGVKVNRKRFAI